MSEEISNGATDLSLKKTRGRPKGSIRDVYFVAVSSNISEQIEVTRGDTVSEDDMRNEAHQSFVSKYKLEPENIYGPFFEAKLTQISSNKRESIRIAEEDVDYTTHLISAECKGWTVVARFIKTEDGLGERQDVVRVAFKKEISPGSKPRAKPHDTFKPLSELENIVEIRRN